MAIVVPVVLGGLALAVMAFVSISASRKGRKARMRAAMGAVHQARILIHSINDDRCTGCDACVAVCPTNVLDLIDNKSRVLRFQDCIQCEACMWACPTEALVMHPEGTQPPVYKMPELDEFYQTAVPGQYLIGEVAGKPLCKNAANLGRAVIEHMLRTGLRSAAEQIARSRDAQDCECVDVAIVGSGPGGLSAALSCIQRGLKYVVLEKENIIASTVARYPKGKLVMAEPYETENLSLLPVFDSTKEEILPIWEELIQRVGLEIRRNETVEKVKKRVDGLFDITTTGGLYRAQKVVLATGTRGKPRTLGAKGENQAKVCSLLEDPDDHRGQAVCVVGGGDSALEAAIALADAGARVILCYRGKSFSRASPKNKQTAEAYAAQRRIKIKYFSQVIEFGEDTVTLQMQDGTMKRYPNQATFVLIGSDPPIKWLATLGIHYIERPHLAALPQSDEFVRRVMGPEARACPDHAAGAAALVQGREVAEVLAEQPVEVISKPRKWLRSASALFTGAGRLDKPMPLREFAKRNRRKHTGHGRRDQLPPRERTRILRMLRDEGGRKADEDSQIYILDRPRSHLADDSPAPAAFESFDVDPAANVVHRPESSPDAGRLRAQQGPPRQAVIVGLAKATAERNRRKRNSKPAPAQQAPNVAPLAPEQLTPAPLPVEDAAPLFIDSSTNLMSDIEDARIRLSEPPPAHPVDRADDATNLVDFDPRLLMQAQAADEPTAAMSIDDVPDFPEAAPPRQPPPPPIPDRQPAARLPSTRLSSPVVSDSMSLERPNRMLTEDAVISSDNPNEGPTRQVDLKELLGETEPPPEDPTRQVDLKELLGETEPLPEDPTKAIEINRLADMEARIKASAGEQVQDDATRALELSERPSTLSDIDWDLD